MSGFGCVCDLCGCAYLAQKWVQPYWCYTCLSAQLRNEGLRRWEQIQSECQGAA